MMKCCRCFNEYEWDDDTTGIFDGFTHDAEWYALDGRCYGCHLDFVFDIFDGWMEPVVMLAGVAYCQTGALEDQPGGGFFACDTGGGDIPF